jgi:hypothetical protein
MKLRRPLVRRKPIFYVGKHRRAIRRFCADHPRSNALPEHLVRNSRNGGFTHTWKRQQDILDFAGAYAIAGGLDEIRILAAEQLEVASCIPAAEVSRAEPSV